MTYPGSPQGLSAADLGFKPWSELFPITLNCSLEPDKRLLTIKTPRLLLTDIAAGRHLKEIVWLSAKKPSLSISELLNRYGT